LFLYDLILAAMSKYVSEVAICTSCLMEIVFIVAVYFAYFVLAFFMLSQHENITTAFK